MNVQTQFGHKEWQVAYGAALRVLKSPDQAEDAAQDALMRAYKARDSFEGKSRFETWLFRIAYTTALGYLRKPHYRRRAALPGGAGDVLNHLAALPSEDTGPEDHASAIQLADRLERCLGSMRQADQIAFTERFIRGTSERELGTMLGVSTNAAKQRAFRVRRAVRACLTKSKGTRCACAA